ncbi:hypothetical protein S83_022069, partial [Arachis hypogaea]
FFHNNQIYSTLLYLVVNETFRDLTQHLTARADDSHAPPVSAFPKAPLSFKRIRGMSSP